MTADRAAVALVERHHQNGATISSAVYSPCGGYRYALTRTWAPDQPRLLYIMLNPSKATEAQNDPTIERCERRARALGFGAFRAMNLFAWRETDPARLRAAPDPTGPENDRLLAETLTDWLRDRRDVALCGWGVHGAHRGRADAVAAVLAATGHPLSCLGTTKSGAPRHPLYVAYAEPPRPWQVPR